MRTLLNLIAPLLAFSSMGQTVRTPVTSLYNRITAYTPNFSDAFSCNGNTASLANVKTLSAGIYGERRFLLQELSLFEAALALPAGSGNFGWNATYQGSMAYNESSIGLAYGRKLGSVADAGVRFNYQSVKVQGYGSAASINFEGGFLLHLSEQFCAGVQVYNPTSTRLGKYEGEKLPSIYTFGFGYETSKQFLVSAELQKAEAQSVSVNAGMQYGLGQQLYARGGFSSGSSTFYLGLGFFIKGIRLDATASVHPQLGLTPGLMLLYHGKEKQL